MSRALSLAMAMAALALPGRALAAHTEVLRSVGDEFTVSTPTLALITLTTFLVVGSLVFFGYRYLCRFREGAR